MKSNVSDLLEVAEAVYIDACAKCIADVSDLRDLKTIRSRVKEEGVSFLTITLPEFSRDFERSLASGQIDPTSFHFWKKTGAIPAFLQGMLGLIFNHETGRIYDERIIDSTSDIPTIVGSVRQICLAFKKVELDCSPKRVAATLENFIATEQSFEMFSLPREDYNDFVAVSSVLWDGMLGDLRLDMLVPKHGPGATAERVSGNQKFVWQFWHERLEPYFPFVDSAYPMSIGELNHYAKELDLVTFLHSDQEIPVRVTPVPKTLKGPRIIAIEPCCMQYAQQGIRDFLYERLESYHLTKGRVNFTDQSINQALAVMASNDGRLATIDLSDASDRVPHDLAMEMFRSNPDLMDAIDACRSTKAEMPDGTIIGPLRKFASMGSALCFPVEAMYFYTLCVMAILRRRELPVSRENIKRFCDVHVYGDDIIVPTDDAIAVLENLQKYNCKVNASKTFVTGWFRESCGADAFKGELVTPTYLRKLRPKNRQQASELISWVQTANLFYLKGYWRTAHLLFARCEEILGRLPYVSENSGALGRTSYLGYRSVERWNERYHRFEVKAWVPSPVYRTDALEGYGALQKALGKLAELNDLSAPRDVLHMEHTALHGAVTLKRRWVPTT